MPGDGLNIFVGGQRQVLGTPKRRLSGKGGGGGGFGYPVRVRKQGIPAMSVRIKLLK